MTTQESRACRGRMCAAVAGCLLAACTGCKPPPPALAPVSGTVLLDGQPLAGGVIIFQPVVTSTDGRKGLGSTARIDPEGYYVLRTIRGEQGASVGKHRVKISTFSSDAQSKKGDSAPRRELVPVKCNHSGDFTFDVPAKGTNAADFLLSTK